MSVIDSLRSATRSTKTLAEQAAAEATELERHIENTRTERARRVATAGDLQRRLADAGTRQDLLKSRRDLASAFDDVDQIDQDLTVVGTRVAELTTELAETREAIKRADLAIPDFQQRQRAAAAIVILEQRRENLAVFEAAAGELLEWYRRGAEIQRRAYIAANREETLRSQPAALRSDGTPGPSPIPALGYLGEDLNQAVEKLERGLAQVGNL